MKHLKSSYRDLQELFNNISVRYIAEPLTSFDLEANIPVVNSFMSEHDYDVVGVRQHGLVTGYVKGSELTSGTFADHVIKFLPSDLVDETTTLIEALRQMRDSPWLFVRTFGHVSGIVTRGDLQKAPVRMWLFGLVSLIEMQLLRIIREGYPNDSWKQFVSDKRLAKARGMHSDRQKENRAIDLADCLQFCDKQDIVLKSDMLQMRIGFTSTASNKRLFKELEQLRNKLAHAQDIVTGCWPEIVDIAEAAERLLEQCEKAKP